MRFEWDEIKNRANLQKHGVSFEEAKSVFYDDFAVQFYDHKNSKEEDRFLMLGMSSPARLLLICHYERNAEHSIRIISARKATKEESKHYSQS